TAHRRITFSGTASPAGFRGRHVCGANRGGGSALQRAHDRWSATPIQLAWTAVRQDARRGEVGNIALVGYGGNQGAQAPARTHDGTVGSDERGGRTPAAPPTGQLASGFGDVHDGAVFREQVPPGGEWPRRGDECESVPEDRVETTAVGQQG